MVTQISSVPWQKSLSLDRSKPPPVFHRFFSNADTLPKDICQFEIDDHKSNYVSTQTLLYSEKVRKNLDESRRAFLNLCVSTEPCEKEINSVQENPAKPEVNHGERKPPTKRISFKIKKTASVYKKTTTTVRMNSVAELTHKFNELNNKQNVVDEQKVAKLVKRVDSLRNSEGPSKVIRKPSVKMKPTFKIEDKFVYVKKRPAVTRKSSIKKNTAKTVNAQTVGDKASVRAKTNNLDISKNTKDLTEVPGNKEATRLKPSSCVGGNVRAAIEIFEQRTKTQILTKKTVTSTPVPKPRVPQKSIGLLTKSLAMKNISKKTPVENHSVEIKVEHNDEKPSIPISDRKTEQADVYISSESLPYFNNAQTHETKVLTQEYTQEIVTKIDETDQVEIVEILSLPLLPPRRCDSLYERQKRVLPPKTLSLSRAEDSAGEESSAKQDMKPNSSFLWRRSSHGSPQGTTYTELQLPSTDGKATVELEQEIIKKYQENWEELYDRVDPQPNNKIDQTISNPELLTSNPGDPLKPVKPAPSPPSKLFKAKMPLPEVKPQDKIYEELSLDKKERDADVASHSYEYCDSQPNYEDLEEKNDDGYEYCQNPDNQEKTENIYETLPLRKPPPPPLLPRRREEPLPPRPPSRNSSYGAMPNGENVSNCYESIYTANSENKTNGHEDAESTYESIYGCQLNGKNWGSASNRDSIVSSEHQSNSIYGRSITSWAEDVFNTYSGRATSDLSSSDRSDDWVDLTDNEDEKRNPGFIIVRERQKVSKKASAWSQQLRDQWSKTSKKLEINSEGIDSDDEHHYETLNANGEIVESHDDDFDSFESDSDSDGDFNKNDSGVDLGNTQLPEPPNNQTYVLTRLAASAGKHMKRLRRNWSLTKNDITKSLSRMTKKKSRTDLTTLDNSNPPPVPSKVKKSSNPSNIYADNKVNGENVPDNRSYQNMEFKNTNGSQELESPGEKNKSLTRKGFLNKFRRSMSMNSDSANELTQNLNKPKSTFYLTETIDIDTGDKQIEKNKENVSPIPSNYKAITRPHSPPPPTPNGLNNKNGNPKVTKRSTSWYAECGLFKNTENISHNNAKRPSSYWYAEVGLYQTSTSTPSTSSAENSGNTNLNASDTLSQEYSDEYYNMKNQNSDYYNRSIDSFSSGDTKTDKTFLSSGDMHLKLQDEPLYQFYDAAVHESECQESISDIDSDGYEEVGDKRDSIISTSRPTAMELVAPNKNVSHARTLWCEIPEVIQSSVLSSLSMHQKKVQEAKFEMLTSEASYLNSLNVLVDHFIENLTSCELLTYEEKELLFGRVAAVKNCSEKLLLDLEECWQENILLHGVCEIIKRHAEENFNVYISYCENQILIDSKLKKLKERTSFIELLKKLELSSTCQSLTLYSFLMLPMQRITRWPLLVDAVLKRLSPQDDEYLTCQYALVILNKTVTQCNEAARKMERKTEMQKIASQLEFGKGVLPFQITSGQRWLVRSGPLTHMQNRGEDMKLTFGKRFSKVPLHLFLFNDMLVITKCKGEDNYVVMHYCSRSLVEMTPDTSLPSKDTQGRHLLFLTLLENQEEKTVEFLLSCSSETDKERWVEALSPTKSEDPNEVLYECWDCPQVNAIHSYTANQSDELALAKGDMINVTRKMADGWYHGERIRDGETGWFPSNYVVEVANPHVRARNLKQRYRLLAFSENYLKSK